MKHQRHLVDGTVARGAADAFVNVNAVVEIHVIGQAMYFHPLNRLVGAVAFAYRFKIADVVEQNGMAVHAGFCGRNAGVGGVFNAGVAITAIDAVIANVMFVAELDGLYPDNTHIGYIRGSGEK